MSEGASPAAATTVDPVRAGRDALVRRDWTAAFELLSTAYGSNALSGDDLEQLAIAAFFAAHAAEGVKATGDGFFVAFETARAGLDCAIAIQRALRDHRDATGFALSVRMGLHSTEANIRGGDYSGVGVHVAARIAALAGGGEIIASAETLEDLADVPTSDKRKAEIRGVSTPVAVARVDWD